VRYAECDRQGHVFNSHYFAYFDVALTELWRAAIGRYDLMIERGVDVVVAEAHARYLRGARFDDEIDLEAAIERLGTTGITTRFRVLRQESLLVDGRLRHVCVDAAALTSTPIPDWLRQALAPWVSAPRTAASPARRSPLPPTVPGVDPSRGLTASGATAPEVTVPGVDRTGG
jgi:acyl-CoA thioester hydrolase